MAVIMVHSSPSLISLIESKVKKINQDLSEKENDDPTVSVSCGVAFGESGISSDVLFKKADTCLYEAKGDTQSSISISKPEKKKGKK